MALPALRLLVAVLTQLAVLAVGLLDLLRWPVKTKW
jgi:hypothetical protein